MKLHFPHRTSIRAERWNARRIGSWEGLVFMIFGNSTVGGSLGEGIRSWFRAARLGSVLLAQVAFGLAPALARGADSDTNSTAAAGSETNLQETLRAYLQVQEQLHLAQLAIEQNRKEARETAAQNSEMLAGRLQTIEKALDSQRTRELEAMQSSNRVMLFVAGSFASVGCVAMLLMSFFQWRTVSRLAEISAALPSAGALGGPPNRPALGAGDSALTPIGSAEQSSLRLLGALDQLEKRIYQLEHTTHTPLNEETGGANGGRMTVAGAGENGTHISVVGHLADAGSSSADLERVSVLMGKGQSMLSLDDAQAAVACFEEVLQLAPDNAEAWVRKGAALERLQQLDQAIDCYDHAIAADNSLTIAYLHKGGLFNRMERFSEALECYEKALRTQEKRQAG